jgi:hypothetical protein
MTSSPPWSGGRYRDRGCVVYEGRRTSDARARRRSGRFATARRALHSEDVRYDDVNSVYPEQPWRQDSESVLCARKRPVKPSDVAGRRILREKKTGSFSGRGAWDTGSCWRRDVGGPPLSQKSLISKSSDST